MVIDVYGYCRYTLEQREFNNVGFSKVFGKPCKKVFFFFISFLFYSLSQLRRLDTPGTPTTTLGGTGSGEKPSYYPNYPLYRPTTSKPPQVGNPPAVPGQWRQLRRLVNTAEQGFVCSFIDVTYLSLNTNYSECCAICERANGFNG